jgi:hypothetical protein
LAATIDVLVSVDGGPLTPWLTVTTLTQAAFPGADGHSYGFAVVASDKTGLRSVLPTKAKAITQVRIASSATALRAGASEVGARQGVTFTAAVTVTDGASWSPSLNRTVQLLVDGVSFGDPVALDSQGVAATPPITTSPVGTHQVVAVFAGNNALKPSTSAPVNLTVNDPSPAPTVSARSAVFLKKKGRVTSLLVTFSGDLDRASAENAASYHLMLMMKGHSRKSVPRLVPFAVSLPSYSAATHIVTLIPPSKLKSGVYQLVITSSASGGIHDAFGQELVGGNATLTLRA